MAEIGVKRFFIVVLFLISNSTLFAQKLPVCIIYIGDSITAGAGLSDPANQAPPVIASAYLQKQLPSDTIILSNQGHSGFTTVDFLPSGDKFIRIEQAAAALHFKHGMLIFSIMLGTNDSAVKGPNGAPVAPDDYQKNLRIIIDRLLKDYPGCKVVIQQPVWYSPNTYNGAQYLQEGLDRLQSYFPRIKELIESYSQTNKKQVFMGDVKAFDYFKNNYLSDLQAEKGHQGTFYLHPNQTGAVALGNFWGEAIYKVINSK